jgi:hypothetical protein
MPVRPGLPAGLPGGLWQGSGLRSSKGERGRSGVATMLLLLLFNTATVYTTVGRS